MKYYFIVGITIGLFLIISSFRELRKIKGKIKTKAIVTGFHSTNGRSDEKVTRIEFSVNGVKRECDLNFYSWFYRKGKKINIYYNPNKYYEIYYTDSTIFLLILGLMFLIGSIISFFLV